MHEDKHDFISKTNSVINTAVKNTSCSRGWLRLVVQSIFCSITVASFCIIVYLSYRRTPHSTKGDNDNTNRCFASNCRVTCIQAPYFGEYEDHIVQTVKEASEECSSVSLTLNRPNFLNSTLPANWLSNLRGHVIELGIVGGNLRHIPADAFMSRIFHNVETLLLDEITIVAWHSEMLQGLFRLKLLLIRQCQIEEIDANALRPVSDTLNQLVVRSSGYYNPQNLTGSSSLTKLEDVNLSSNYFYDILSRNSFKELIRCRVLSLASSRITAIQDGTFDVLEDIKVIYLNNNRIVSLPPRIFDGIVMRGKHQIRIDLRDNMWDCNCKIERLRKLYEEGIVIADPVCQSPKELNGTPFSEITTFCNDSNETTVNTKKMNNNDKKEVREILTVTIYIDRDCYTNTSIEEKSEHFFRRFSIYSCNNGRMRYHDSNTLKSITKNSKRSSLELQPMYYMQDENFSLVEININVKRTSGLIWYQSSCPNEVHCIDRVPTHMRLYNVGKNEWYTLCPIHRSGFIREQSCIAFYPSTDISVTGSVRGRKIYFYIVSLIAAILIGALLIYGLILKNPVLLKGNKRVLIVKHKFAEALVLPPKIPVRCDTITRPPLVETNILTVPARPKRLTLTTPSLSRSSSIRSCKSSTPSYVSAIQPTDDQLMEWRLRQHFQPSLVPPPTVTTTDQISWIYNSDSRCYSISRNSENMYENMNK